jgi:hypothetical protein
MMDRITGQRNNVEGYGNVQIYLSIFLWLGTVIFSNI